MSIPRTAGGAYRHLRDELKGAGIDTADLDSRIMIRQRTGKQWADLIVNDESDISAAGHLLSEDLERRLAGEPVSRIYGIREFWGLDFEISPDVLDPRPDTETIIRVALERFQDRPPVKILDLGTGSGCLPVALLHEFPDSGAVAADKSEAALCVAGRNAVRHGVADRILFLCGSWCDSLQEKFDLVVSNPPYIPNPDIKNLAKEVQNHDPILSLDGGSDGLDAYRKVFSTLKNYICEDGIGLFEIGFGQQNDVVRLAEDSGLSVKHVHADYAGRARVVEISGGDK